MAIPQSGDIPIPPVRPSSSSGDEMLSPSRPAPPPPTNDAPPRPINDAPPPPTNDAPPRPINDATPTSTNDATPPAITSAPFSPDDETHPANQNSPPPMIAPPPPRQPSNPTSTPSTPMRVHSNQSYRQATPSCDYSYMIPEKNTNTTEKV